MRNRTEQMKRFWTLRDMGVDTKTLVQLDGLIEDLESPIRDIILARIEDELFIQGFVEETDDKFSLMLTYVFDALIYKLNTNE